MIGQEHCDGCVGCLALWLSSSICHVMIRQTVGFKGETEKTSDTYLISDVVQCVTDSRVKITVSRTHS